MNVVNEYRRAVDAQLRCNARAKRRLQGEFQGFLEDYLADNSRPSREDLEKAFGTPREMAAILMNELTYEECVQYDRSRQIRRIALGVLVALFACLTFYIWFIKEVGLTVINSAGIIDETGCSVIETISKEDMP